MSSIRRALGRPQPALTLPYVALLVLLTCCAWLGLAGSQAFASSSPPKATTEPASNLQLGGSTATLSGAVNPEGAELEECKFEYGEEAETYGHAVLCEEPDAAEIGTGTEVVPVHADLSDLAPDTVYHFRLVVKNSHGEGEGADRSFANEGPFGFLPGAAGFDGSITNQDGSADTQAGSHPYQMTTSFALNNHFDPSRNETAADGDVRDATVNLPAGLIVNPDATTKCTEAQLESTAGGGCPNSAAVGTVKIDLGFFGEQLGALYNMVHPVGAPAELGFPVIGLGIFDHLTGTLRTGGDYGLSATGNDLLAKGSILGVSVTLWGNPSDPSHDGQRGECAEQGGSCPVPPTNTALLIQPTSCSGPLTTTIEADDWQNPGNFLKDSFESHDQNGNPVGNNGCSVLDFSPSLTAQPEATATDSPTGLHVDLHAPQDEEYGGLAEADLKKAVVTLPKGLVLNPSTAGGRQACSAAQIGLTSAPATSPPTFTAAAADCPEASKIGTAEVDTPLLEAPLDRRRLSRQALRKPLFEPARDLCRRGRCRPRRRHQAPRPA